MKQVGIPYLFQANFPRSQSGKLSDIRYRVMNDIGVTVIPYTNTGIVDFENGKYGVKVAFSNAGSWSIEFIIINTPYVAGEEINVYDDAVIYSSFGA